MRPFHFLTLALLAQGLFVGTLTVAAGPESRPVLRVAQAQVELGTQRPGPELEFLFRLRNEGSAALDLREIQPSYGCVVEACERTIAPGGEATLRLRVTTEGLGGALCKIVRVTTNDPRAPLVILVARAWLQAPAAFPSLRYLASVADSNVVISRYTLSSS